MEEASSLFERFLRTYPEGSPIFEEGAAGYEMFIVHSGKVKLLKKSKGGEDKTLTVLGPGEFFGEMSLIDGSPRSTSAVAGEEGAGLIVLDMAKFMYLIQQHPMFSYTIMGKLSQRLREANVSIIG
ncbi:MAG: cyclic nucleotide-binding domain-containing protein [Chloroflexi bacterium]|nr:cyclic nucleotide-binding domain-containing protein [Chloroflexota bacterium]MBM3154455.1 cyclic nucleotide-binding domain-containing protein [Chloroflexota bacterium]MBM3165885.1 cyclic nucleotide-binding domain-containing protein [Chloroflexota bacterium]MBM3173262.1 cyclic nucleotide-binding domain-containing protein [Chloroflexota bacterium]MBM4449253.1 cyclic nucleotide-binding domain-containing protein [Chloroflexota bacterium]